MRTYLITEDKQEYVFDLVKTINRGENLFEFKYLVSLGGKKINEKSVFIKNFGNSCYSSFDFKKWTRFASQKLPEKILNTNQLLSVFRGYKPSWLESINSGELLTQMPGKVVKVFVETGQKIKKRETLLILEAMKMENEIKADKDGIIKNIYVKEGQSLESGTLLIEIGD